MQRDEWIHFGGTPRGKESGERRHGHDEQRRPDKRGDISWCDSEQNLRDPPARAEGSADTDCDAVCTAVPEAKPANESM